MRLPIYKIKSETDLMLEQLEKRLEDALDAYLDEIWRNADYPKNYQKDEEIQNFKNELIHDFERLDNSYELIDVFQEEEPEKWQQQKDFINKWARNDV